MFRQNSLALMMSQLSTQYLQIGFSCGNLFQNQNLELWVRPRPLRKTVVGGVGLTLQDRNRPTQVSRFRFDHAIEHYK